MEKSDKLRECPFEVGVIYYFTDEEGFETYERVMKMDGNLLHTNTGSWYLDTFMKSWRATKAIQPTHNDHLLEMAAEALGDIMPVEIVQGDTVHRVHPASLQVVNSNCAWLVSDGERSAHKLQLRLEKAQQTLLTLQQHGYGKE